MSSSSASSGPQPAADTFQVEEIVSSKTIRRGRGTRTLYQVRWKGFTAADDTWEPLENVAFTGHVDRYVRKERALKFQSRSRGRNTPGTALIEYDDGEKEWVDLTQEKFLMDSGSNPSEYTDEVEGREIDWTLIHIGANIKLFWEYANIYFPAEILDWEPLHSTGKKIERRPSLIGSTKFRGKTMCIPNQENEDEDNTNNENPRPSLKLVPECEVESTEETVTKVVSDEMCGDNMLDDTDVLSVESKSSVETEEIEVISIQPPKSSAAAAAPTRKHTCFKPPRQDSVEPEEIEITSVQPPQFLVAAAAAPTKKNACFNTLKQDKPALSNDTAALATNIDDFFLNSDDEEDDVATEFLTEESKLLDLMSDQQNQDSRPLDVLTSGDQTQVLHKNQNSKPPKKATAKPSTHRHSTKNRKRSAKMSAFTHKKSTKKKKHEAGEQPSENCKETSGSAVYTVECISDCRVNRHGVALYRVRWLGFGPADDTWEPIENVAHTGHVDRYICRQRAKSISPTTPGAALIEYGDRERQLVDLRQEIFRRSLGAFVDSTNVESENDFSIVHEGAKIDLFWPHTDLFFACTVISWAPLQLNARPREDTSSLEVSKPKTKKHEANGKCMASQDNQEGKKPIARTVEKLNSLRRCSESGIEAASILQSFTINTRSSRGLVSPETANKLPISSINVGLKIEVYWPMDLTWYVCVVERKCDDGRFQLLYDDGEIEIVRMEDQIWRPLAAAAAISTTEPQDSLSSQDDGKRKTEAAQILHSFQEQHTHSIVTDEDFCWRRESKGTSALASSENE